MNKDSTSSVILIYYVLAICTIVLFSFRIAKAFLSSYIASEKNKELELLEIKAAVNEIEKVTEVILQSAISENKRLSIKTRNAKRFLYHIHGGVEHYSKILKGINPSSTTQQKMGRLQ